MRSDSGEETGIGTETETGIGIEIGIMIGIDTGIEIGMTAADNDLPTVTTFWGRYVFGLTAYRILHVH